MKCSPCPIPRRNVDAVRATARALPYLVRGGRADSALRPGTSAADALLDTGYCLDAVADIPQGSVEWFESGNDGWAATTVARSH